MGFGRWSTIIVLASLAVIGVAGATRLPLAAQQVRDAGGIRALALTKIGLGDLAPVPQQPFATVKSPSWAATDAAVKQMQDRIAGNPTDPTLYAAYAQLGSLYLQKVRETGDPSYYARAEGALQKSLEIAPDNVLATIGMGGLHLARHSFAEALEWGELARRQAPFSHVPYGIIGDAYVELGRYEEAVDAFQQMIDHRPDLSSYSRVSYARELHGDLPGAVEAMERAVGSGNARSEGTNWARVQLGHLRFLVGDLDGAEREYRQALGMLPDYAPAIAGLGKIEAARGNYAAAIERYTRAQQVMPQAEYAVALGDVYRAAGNERAAAKQDELVRVIAQLQRGGGMDVDLDMALFEADRAADAATIEAAVATARAQYARRPSVHAADVLAWALYRAGQPADALTYARESLKLGSKDPVMLYHAGAIAAAAGQPAEARAYLEEALRHNDRFHVRYAPAAKRLLEQIGKSA